jgi:hypothetical protein
MRLVKFKAFTNPKEVKLLGKNVKTDGIIMTRWSSFLVIAFLFHFNPTKDCWAAGDGIEASITLSGTILLGVGYYHQFDNSSVVRLGACSGFRGFPIGINFGLVGRLAPDDCWSPTIGLGGDALLAKSNNQLRLLPYVRSTVGFDYQPHPNLSHHAELWIAYFVRQHRLAPIGLNFSHRNSMK